MGQRRLPLGGSATRPQASHLNCSEHTGEVHLSGEGLRMKLSGLVRGILRWLVVLGCAFPALAQVVLQGEHFQATLSSQTGQLISVAPEGQSNTLARPVAISIRDEMSGKVHDLTAPLENLERRPSEVSFTQQTPDLEVETTFT